GDGATAGIEDLDVHPERSEGGDILSAEPEQAAGVAMDRVGLVILGERDVLARAAVHQPYAGAGMHEALGKEGGDETVAGGPLGVHDPDGCVAHAPSLLRIGAQDLLGEKPRLLLRPDRLL